MVNKVEPCLDVLFPLVNKTEIVNEYTSKLPIKMTNYPSCNC